MVLPVRGLGKNGIIKDIEPWDVPMTAWTGGLNVRFANEKALRAQVFREVLNADTSTTTTTNLLDASGICAFRPNAGQDLLFVADSTGRVVQRLDNNTILDVSGADWTANAAATQYTSCVLSDVLYLNRESHVPRYWGPASNTFTLLPNWDADWRCNIFRAYQDFLVAFAVEKSGTFYGQMVKWSDATLAGTYPDTWDATLAAGLQGENELAEMSSEIVDANNLRNSMIIYGQRETWLMQFTGDATYPFTFSKIFGEVGAIGRNCSVEVNGKHYVFGTTDLWVHDGTSWQSIANQRIRDFVFGSANQNLTARFFVSHDPVTRTVRFHYVSGDGDVTFHYPTLGCNKVAAYCYESDTWGFEEEPCVAAEVISNLDNAQMWSDMPITQTWANMGGSWISMMDTFKPLVLAAGNALTGFLTHPRLYALDPMDKNSRVVLPASIEANTPAFVERTGIDLDNAGLPLANFKLCRNVDPLAYIYRNVPVTIQVGAAELPQDLPLYGAVQTFNPNTQYRINTRAAGRFLSIRIGVEALADFEVSGFDLDVISQGRR